MARGKSGGGKKGSARGGKGKYRSAISGRYVTAKHGKSSPRTTVREIKGELKKQGRRFDDSTDMVRRDRESR